MGIAACRCFTGLGEGASITRVDTVDGVESVDGIADGARKCTYGILVVGFWDYSGGTVSSRYIKNA